MPTKPLPFLEKDAIRWRDHAALALNEIRGIIRACYMPSVVTRLEALTWQMENLVNDVEDTIAARKGDAKR